MNGETRCVIAGAGPGGAMLALLLARRGVPVTLLEMHKDFDREFRGDTVHPSTLEILDQLELAEKVHKIPHSKVYGPSFMTSNGLFQPFDLRRLKTKFPYILMIPQSKFLELLTSEAAQYPQFRLKMGANVYDLVRENGFVRGVRYQTSETQAEMRALLTVGADGRHSRVRHLAGFEPVKTSPPMDVLWFKLPKLGTDMDAGSGLMGSIRAGRILVVLDRFDSWQVGFVFPKGQYQQVKATGMEAMRHTIVELEPRFAEHVETLRDWQQLTLLSVESSRCLRWHHPGLLLIGDAAHVMSPVGGVGINYAIQDAVVAANVLSKPLLEQRLEEKHLAEVQRQREFPTKFIQGFQAMIQKRVLAPALASTQTTLQVPAFVRWLVRMPILRDLPPRLIGFGVQRVRVDS
ncbi:MAG TPA: FAD-dependent oxidoreductase [Bryobacteraceae bacterium]|jgi:2-polyprenyl-6-methoxyphenol hydroxylase-like FAD-dependent oxidoreductase|nr:FAD-dependent oxidoreductase [Bryobacteraceae bacterium]